MFSSILNILPLFYVLCYFGYDVDASSFRDKWLRSQIKPEDVEFLLKPLKPTKSKLIKSHTSIPKVGIVGAGISGLYAALLLDSLNIPFEIHEANSEHLGGRAFTYHFNKNYKNAKKCADYYDYGEMGCMRIPISSIRLIGNVPWSLVNYLNSQENVQPKVKLIPFYYSNENTFYYYNNRKIFSSNDQLDDPLGFGDAANGGEGMGVPDSYASRPFWEWTDYVNKPFYTLMDTNLTKAYEFLAKYDNNSVRSFMATFDAKQMLLEMGLNNSYTSPIDSKSGQRLDRAYPQFVIDWIESLDSGTGLYDSSLTETIIDAYTFTSNEWVTIDGGMSRLVDGLSDALSLSGPQPRLFAQSILGNKRLFMGSKITRIFRENNSQISITNKAGQVYKYDHVISTLPLGVLQTLDTSSLNFDLKKRMAMRSLLYGNAVKIIMKFKTRWWQDAKKMNGKPISGGQTFTDLPIRLIVYPSFGVNCSDAPGNLLVSYTWSQDATRLGARITPKTPSQRSIMQEDELIEDVLTQLTQIHGEMVRAEYMGKYYAYNWNDNRLSFGANALFFPSEFMTLYRSMIKAEADGRVHFAGEATSVHHAWIEGALNSGYRSVMEILMKENMREELRKFLEMWGTVDELSFFI